jgi:hypothetical protein
MPFTKSPIAVAALALFGALPLAAQAQSTPAPSSGSLDVWFKAPKSGATVSGVLNGGTSCYVNASGAISRVQFSVDGASLNTDSKPSDGMQCVLDTTKLSNGSHQLRADAYDSKGNRRSDLIGINVSNTATSGGTTGDTTGGTTTGGTTTGGATTGGTSSGYAGTPYSGSAATLPGTIPAVNFDKGGQGVAYNDLSSGNLGGLYRTSESPDIYASTDSGAGAYQIANFQTGEWMSYTVNVATAGSYDLGIRAANNAAAGAFHIEVDGVDATGSIPVANTGSWTAYQWFGKKGVALAAGKHVVKLVSDSQWFNVSALSAAASSTSTGGTSSGGTGTGSGGGTGGSTYAGLPYTGTAIALPATVAAANFDKGGEGVAYHDLSSGNLGGLYRTSESPDIYASTDSAGGPYQIANFQTGEWMSYTVNVATAGNYDLGIRAANNYAAGAFHIEVDGVNVTGTIPVALTGSWTAFQWFGKQGVPLAAGKHVVKVVSEKQWFNVSALSVLQSGSTSTGSTGDSTGGSTGGSTASKPANLLFWSGYEGSLSLLTPNDCYGNGCYQQLSGSDSSTGYSWPVKLMNGDNKFQMISNSSTMPSPTTIGNWMYNQIQTVVGHKGNSTKALYSEVLQSGCCGTDGQGGGSTQNAFLAYPGAEPGDMYISKWLKLQPDLLDKLAASPDGSWRVIFEWKEGGYTTAGGAFRTILIVNMFNGKPSWQVKWDNDANGGYPKQEFWRTQNSSVPIPVGEWFKLEVFWHRAKDGTGRIWYAVNGLVIDDHRGTTIGVNNDPIGRIMINQVYSGTTYPIYQWTDDIQIWQGWPTAKQGDPWYDPPYAPH